MLGSQKSENESNLGAFQKAENIYDFYNHKEIIYCVMEIKAFEKQ